MKIILILLMAMGLFANPPKTLYADRIQVKVDGYEYMIPLFVMCIEKTKCLVKGYSDTSPVQMMKPHENPKTGTMTSIPMECD